MGLAWMTKNLEEQKETEAVNINERSFEDNILRVQRKKYIPK